MKFIAIALIITSLKAYGIIHLPVPVNDLETGSHEIDSVDDKYNKRVITKGMTSTGATQSFAASEDGAALTSDSLVQAAISPTINITNVNIFGGNNTVNILTAPEDIWEGGGEYTGQPIHSIAAETLVCVSGSGNDSSAGTGARTIEITGLDENFEKQGPVSMTMNGTSGVETTQSWKRVTKVIVKTVGSTGGNEGVISCAYSATTSIVFAVIQIGDNISSLLAYTVPLGKTILIRRIRIQIVKALGLATSAVVSLRIREEGGAFISIIKENVSNTGAVVFTLLGGIRVPQKSDIKMRVNGVTVDASILNASIEMIEITN